MSIDTIANMYQNIRVINKGGIMNQTYQTNKFECSNGGIIVSDTSFNKAAKRAYRIAMNTGLNIDKHWRLL